MKNLTQGNRDRPPSIWKRALARLFALRTKILALFVSILVCCIAAEIGLRLFTPNWLDHRMSKLNPANERAVKGSDRNWPAEMEGKHFRRFTPNEEWLVSHYEYNRRVNIDSYGGRRSGGPDAKNARFLVPVLGDSFTFGIGVSDNETFVSLLNKGAEIKYLNLGVPGNCLAHQIEQVKLRHQELGNPKSYVFAFFMGNDFDNLVNYYSPEKQEADITQSVLASINAFVYHNSFTKRLYLLQFIQRGLRNLYNKTKDTPAMESVFLAMNSSNLLYRDKAKEALAQALGELRVTSRDLNFDPIFILIPDRYQVNSDQRDMLSRSFGLSPSNVDAKYPTDLISNELKKLNIPFIDTSADLSEDRSLYYSQDAHLTPKGHKAVRKSLNELDQKVIEYHTPRD